MEVKIKCIENGKVPTFIRIGDVCSDCYANEKLVIKPNERKLVKLGFALELPTGYEAIIRPRSGLSKKGIDIAIGSIDTNYRGEVMANVINNSCEDFEVNVGDRICQMAIRSVPYISFILSDELSSTERGKNGFGSSGVN